MPELPEVETTCNGIRSALIKQSLAQVIIRHHQLRQPIPKNQLRSCMGQSVQAVTRRGKYILLEMEASTLIIHLGMSGYLSILNPYLPPKKHDHIDLIFSNHCMLRYTDPRRFGLWAHTCFTAQEHPLLSRLGIEPLSEDFTAAVLYEKSQAHTMALKKFIMDPRIIVGVGNIYASESLFVAQLHPLKAANTLSKKECERLCRAIKKILSQAIDQGGTTLKDFMSPTGKPGYFRQTLQAYGRENQPCPQCQNPIQSLTIGGRNSFFCARCQS